MPFRGFLALTWHVLGFEGYAPALYHGDRFARAVGILEALKELWRLWVRLNNYEAEAVGMLDCSRD